MKINNFTNFNTFNNLNTSVQNRPNQVENTQPVTSEKLDKSKISIKDFSTAAYALSLSNGKDIQNAGIYTKEEIFKNAQKSIAASTDNLQDFALTASPKVLDNVSIAKASLENITPADVQTNSSDPQMDNFLHQAFKAFELDY